MVLQLARVDAPAAPDAGRRVHHERPVVARTGRRPDRPAPVRSRGPHLLDSPRKVAARRPPHTTGTAARPSCRTRRRAGTPATGFGLDSHRAVSGSGRRGRSYWPFAGACVAGPADRVARRDVPGRDRLEAAGAWQVTHARQPIERVRDVGRTNRGGVVGVVAPEAGGPRVVRGKARPVGRPPAARSWPPVARSRRSKPARPPARPRRPARRGDVSSTCVARGPWQLSQTTVRCADAVQDAYFGSVTTLADRRVRVGRRAGPPNCARSPPGGSRTRRRRAEKATPATSTAIATPTAAAATAAVPFRRLPARPVGRRRRTADRRAAPRSPATMARRRLTSLAPRRRRGGARPWASSPGRWHRSRRGRCCGAQPARRQARPRA